MKKFVLGILCGAFLFGGTSVLAESISLVGKKIEKEIPVNYNGEPLVAKAIVVEGTSYLPVRTVGNTLGATVEFKDGVIHVEKTNDYDVIRDKVMNDIKREMRIEELREEISKLKEANEKIKESLEIVENDIEKSTVDGGYIEGSLMAKANLESAIQNNLKKISELEAELAELEQQPEQGGAELSDQK